MTGVDNRNLLDVKRESIRRVMPQERNLLMIVFMLLTILAARLWYLQVAQGDELAARAEMVRTRLLRTPPPRGLIMDRNNVMLAENVATNVVTVLPDPLRKNPRRIRLIADRLRLDPKELEEAIRNPQINPFVPLIVETGVSLHEAASLMESLYNLPEVEVRPQPVRRYRYGKPFAHVLGYVGQISQEELKTFSPQEPEEPDPESLPVKLYDGSDFVGKNGIEREYERYLHGVPGGDRVEVTPVGRQVRVLETLEPGAGTNLTLTLDAKLQQRGFELLSGRKGALVAIDPRSGEVLALVSQPSFDANLFVGRIPLALWKQLTSDKGYPLNNRAIQSAYPPGSTFKPFAAMAGLRSGTITAHSGITCGGGLRLGTRTFKCLGRHGTMNVYSAIARSCNTYFYENARRMGPDKLASTVREFGFGTRTRIDLPHERAGIVPDPEWKKNIYKQEWYGGETLNFGIGQGYMNSTPLQLALATAAVANRGTVYKPRLVRWIAADNSSVVEVSQPEVMHQIDAPANYWDAVISGMVQAVEGGTARGCRLPGIKVAGKTGSAQARLRGRTHSWFIAFAPADNPRVALCVLAEEAGHGSDVAVPIAREWLRTFFDMDK